jgi:hypothetical protein
VLEVPPIVRHRQSRFPEQADEQREERVRLRARQLMKRRATGKKLIAGSKAPATRNVK